MVVFHPPRILGDQLSALPSFHHLCLKTAPVDHSQAERTGVSLTVSRFTSSFGHSGD